MTPSPTDPLDVWREAFEGLPEDTGQLRLYLGPGELEQTATRAEVEAQAKREADRRDVDRRV